MTSLAEVFRMNRAIKTHVQGGLGNQLFIFATSFAVAKANRRQLELDFSWYTGGQREPSIKGFRREPDLLQFPRIARSFSIRGQQGHASRARLRSSSGIGLTTAINLDKVEAIPKMRLRSSITGHMFKPNWFSDYRTELSQLLMLDPEVQMEIECSLGSWAERSGRRVAVHVRRGDSVIPENMHLVLSPRYFLDVLDYLGAASDEVAIFSDSPDWCKNHPVFGQFKVVDESRPQVALKLMSMADSFVLSPSTFSWWAAWLGRSQRKQVIVPEPFQPVSPTHWCELIMPGWSQWPGDFVYDSTLA